MAPNFDHFIIIIIFKMTTMTEKTKVDPIDVVVAVHLTILRHFQCIAKQKMRAAMEYSMYLTLYLYAD